ncbi:hypothetical protein P3875_11375 [Myroides sp. JBRI-B21084]|uniref:hypothetical protein n=1 Tax=Myroides sp. JBRI-B21084 TaxID=3119977 RepID=UPI0026E43EFE|nr:hypothetical protein [Paenimyroides cloacae]WKW46358.1 hypothetical protein P3875_11375 [Paenimyroides cloacae]
MKNYSYLLLMLLATCSCIAQENKKVKDLITNNKPKENTESYLLSTLINNAGTNVTQIGNNNHSSIETNTMNVVQNGDNQLLFYAETNTLEESNLTVQMQGNNNYIEIFGNNSIMDQMQINLSGSDKTIIIRNY